MLHGRAPSASRRACSNPSHDGVKRPGTREMTVDARRADGAQRLRDRRDGPGAARHRPSLHVVQENHRQLVVIAYFLGFASTQLLWGPLADRFGRKPVLAVGVVLYGAVRPAVRLCGSFPLLIAGRVAMGASAAVTRVLVIAMVRDLFEAEAMARVMSLVFMTFMLVPVLAPNIGQPILLVAPWRAIFVVLALCAHHAGLVVVAAARNAPPRIPPLAQWREMPARSRRRSATRSRFGYTIAVTVIFAGLVAYITSIQQIVFDAFHDAAASGWCSPRSPRRWRSRRWTNSRRRALRPAARRPFGGALARRGHRRMPAGACRRDAVAFIVFQALTMCCFAFTSSNLGTLAMEHMAPIAGTASSVQGVVGTLGGGDNRLCHRPGLRWHRRCRSCSGPRLRRRRLR